MNREICVPVCVLGFVLALSPIFVHADSYAKINKLNLEGVVSPTYPSIQVDLVSPTDGTVVSSQNAAPASTGDYIIDLGSWVGSVLNVRVKAMGFLSRTLPNLNLASAVSAGVTIPQLSGGDVKIGRASCRERVYVLV